MRLFRKKYTVRREERLGGKRGKEREKKEEVLGLTEP